ncbi:MAG: hypothetical protein AMS17_03920 [Spirochaetes bacterium DG_61]|nr:MAG: hypothetical protein AMS17_03920 [Spirochaetes bacterium DG_61]
MEWLRLSKFAIGSLPTGVLLWGLTIFLLSIKKKSTTTWLLIGYFSVLSILLLSYVLRYSILSRFVFNTGQLSNLIVFGVVSYLLFAYKFQENSHPLESKIVTVLFLIAALYIYISIFLRYLVLEKTYDFQAHYFTYVFGPGISIVTGLGYFWIIIVFLRKTILVSEYAGPLIPSRQNFLSMNRLTNRLTVAVLKIIRPRGKRAKSLLSFALLTFGMFSVSFLYLLMSTRVISRETYGFLFNAGGLLTTFAIFIVYTNYTFEPSSFRWKLVGLSLAPIMVIMGIVGSIILSLADTSFDNQRKLETGQIKSMLSLNGSLKLPLEVSYIASRPKGGGRYSDTYVIEKSQTEGLEVKDFIESDRIEREKELAKSEEVLFMKNTVFNREQSRTTTQNEIDRLMHPEMVRRFRYFDLYDTDSFFIHYDFIFGDRLYEIGYSYKWYRTEIHRTAIKLFYIIIGTTVIIMILFPVLFYRNLFQIDLRIF